jgi:hypothetical protein
MLFLITRQIYALDYYINICHLSSSITFTKFDGTISMICLYFITIWFSRVVWFFIAMVFSATFNNISVISWRSVLLVLALLNVFYCPKTWQYDQIQVLQLRTSSPLYKQYTNTVLLVEEIEVPGENHLSIASHRQTLSYNNVSSTPRHERDSNSQL